MGRADTALRSELEGIEASSSKEGSPVLPARVSGTTMDAGQLFERPAAAFALLSNERGTAVEDTFVLMDDLLLQPTHPHCAAAVPLFGV